MQTTITVVVVAFDRDTIGLETKGDRGERRLLTPV